MRIIPSNYKKTTNLPLKLNISFEAVFEYLEKIAEDKQHYLNNTANRFLNDYKKYPELRNGFEDFSYLEKYNSQIDTLLDFLFPALLQDNEIKAASIPFEFTTFKLSKRFENIIDNAGDDYKLELRNFDEENIYILSCTFILAYCHNFNIDFRRPFYFDIPDVKTGITKHYRTLFNGDFFKVRPLENAPKITEEDVKVLIDNFNNIDIWKEKFPPNSYEFKGFGIMNLFDVTPDQSLSNLRENLLKKDDDAFAELQQSISNLFGLKSLKFGFSSYSLDKDSIAFKNKKNQKSYLIQDDEDCRFDGFFCQGIVSKIFHNNELIAISDVEKYAEATHHNGLSKILLKQGIQSIILVPLKLNNDLMGIMELVSENKYELNSINAYKLEDVIPVFKIAIQRYMEEFENKLESVIQENYTSLHPTVKWKFYEEAEAYLMNVEGEAKATANLKSIVFENVIPLYGQSDIKGSSTVRNEAIQEDLVKQLKLAAAVIEKANNLYNLPIYSDLLFRIDECLYNIKKGLNSGDEVMLTTFLKRDIYPVFNHLKTLNSDLEQDVKNYMEQIDDRLHVVYEKRKKYENSVNLLNEKLANFIDSKQEEAQKMFPHYFECLVLKYGYRLKIDLRC